MPLIYALVSRGKTVLAEYTCAQGNFPTVTRILLSKLSLQDSKMSYVYDNNTSFHYIIDNGIIFLCLSDGDMKRRLVFSFLEEIKNRWRKQFIENEQNAIAFSMNLAFSPILKSQLEIYNTNPPADNISRVQSQIDNVKNVMVDNIERVLERGEKIELLVDKTDKLGQQAFKFQKTAKHLKNAMYMKKIKIIIFAVVLTIILAFGIAMLSCGVKLDQC